MQGFGEGVPYGDADDKPGAPPSLLEKSDVPGPKASLLEKSDDDEEVAVIGAGFVK